MGASNPWAKIAALQNAKLQRQAAHTSRIPARNLPKIPQKRPPQPPPRKK